MYPVDFSTKSCKLQQFTPKLSHRNNIPIMALNNLPSLVSFSLRLLKFTQTEARLLKFVPATNIWLMTVSLYYVLFLPTWALCQHGSLREQRARLSRAGIVSKRRKLATWFLHHLVAPQFQFSDAKFHPDILRGPLGGDLKQGWGGKIQPFSSFKHQYLENGSR